MPHPLYSLFNPRMAPDAEEQTFDDSYDALTPNYEPGEYAAERAATNASNSASVRNMVPRTGARNNVEIGALRSLLGLPAETYQRSVNPHDPFSAMETAKVEYDGPQSDYDSALKHILDQQQEQEAAKEMAKAQAQTIPERVRGEYGLAGERIKSQSAAQVAAANKEAAFHNAEAAREFNAGQRQQDREAAYGRTQLQQSGSTMRGAAAERGRQSRQLAGQNESRAKMLESGKVHAPGAAGWYERLFGPSQKTRDQQAAAELRKQNSQAAAADNGFDAARNHYAQFAQTMSPDQLSQMMLQDQPDVSQEDIQQMLDSLYGGR